MPDRNLIVVIDPEPMPTGVTARAERDGYRIVSCPDIDAALTRVSDSPADYAMVIIDAGLLNSGDRNVLTLFREDSRLQRIPVVVVSSENDTVAEVAAFEAGAAEFLVKPLDAVATRQRLLSVIESREVEDMRVQDEVVRELKFQVRHDPLTGIYTRAAFCEATRKLLDANPDTEFILVRWNIERFKVINDLFGTDAGDFVLRYIADTMTRFMGGIGTYGRLESDHFASCVPAKYFDPELMAKTTTLSFTEQGIMGDVVLSIGVFEIEDPSIPVSAMCDRALVALNTVKGDYVHRVAYFTKEMRKRAIDDRQVVDNAPDALENKEFEVYFQPIYSLETGRPVAAEALVRWNRPGVGLIPPGNFIPQFERNGFITSLDQSTWEQVCRVLEQRQRDGLEPIPLSVNVSRVSLFDQHLFDEITHLVERFDFDKKLFRIEVTESAYLDDAQRLISTVAKLREYGLTVVMDDFGSGYSSLNSLKDIPVDIVKIDMDFLNEKSCSDRSKTILQAIIGMMKDLNATVVAEGVETFEQCDFLCDAACDYVQGYYFATPMPYPEFESHVLHAQSRSCSMLESD